MPEDQNRMIKLNYAFLPETIQRSFWQIFLRVCVCDSNSIKPIFYYISRIHKEITFRSYWEINSHAIE